MQVNEIDVDDGEPETLAKRHGCGSGCPRKAGICSQGQWLSKLKGW